MFKLLFKPIKWILKIVLGFVILLAIPVILLYKPVKKPVSDGQSLTMEEYIGTEIDNLIDESNSDKIFGLKLNEDLLNVKIEEELKKQFSPSSNVNYIYEDGNIMFQGVWLKFSENHFDIIAGVHLNARIMKYKTSANISFELLSSDNGELTLTLKKFKVGHLSLKWAIKHAPSLVKRFLGTDIDEFIENSLNGIGEYDNKKMQLKVNLYTLTDQLEENKELAVTILDVLYQNELIKLDISKLGDGYQLKLALDLNKVHDNSVVFKLSDVDKIKTEEEFASFLRNRALSSLLSNESSLKLNKLAVNKLIDFIINQGLNLNTDYLLEETVYANYNLKVLKPFVEFRGSKLILNVPIQIGDNLNAFKTIVKLETEFKVSGNDLEINLKNLNFGNLGFDSDDLSAITNLLGEGLVVDNKIIVKDFLDNFKGVNINVTDIVTSNDSLNIVFEGLNTSNLLGDIIDEITDPELLDVVNTIKDKLDSFDTITEEDIKELLEAIETLDEAEYDKLVGIIGNQGNWT